MGEKKTLHKGIVIAYSVVTVLLGVSDLVIYLLDHPVIIPTIIITTMYSLLIGSQFYFGVRKFETLDQVQKAEYVIASLDLICIVVLLFMKRDSIILALFIGNIWLLGDFIKDKVKLREEGVTPIQDSDILSD